VPLLLFALAATGCLGGDDQPSVRGVTLTAKPNGPTVRAGDGGRVPLARIARLVPRRLPPSLGAACDTGVRVTVLFDDGGATDYGPCALPADIDRLRAAVVRESLRVHDLRLEPAGRRCARAVLADWYRDGRVDRVYQLRCYGDVMRALPESEMTPPLRRAAEAASVGLPAG
jgi:hypothetical protein